MSVDCSFCGKMEFEVWKILTGPQVNICSDCVTMCVKLLNELHRQEEIYYQREEIDIDIFMQLIDSFWDYWDYDSLR